MAHGTRPTRRALIRAGVVAVTAGFAGCDGTGNGTPPDPSTATRDNPVIEDVTVDGSDLVVTLEQDHDVSRLNLIDDDGESFASTTVHTGETTARIELLDIKPGIGGFDHYDPGRYELVAVREQGSNSIDVDLEPELRITDVQQYRNGSNPADLGKLAVTVENVGTGPTWVYVMTYEDAPNELVNDPINSDPGLPQLTLLEGADNLILGPAGSEQFVGDTSPLVLDDDGEQICDGSHTFTLIIGTAVGVPLRKQITATFSGDTRSTGLTGEYTCGEISVNSLESEE